MCICIPCPCFPWRITLERPVLFGIIIRRSPDIHWWLLLPDTFLYACYNVPTACAKVISDASYLLCRWRLVVHGAIDGFSRFVAFLHCSDNNRSATVLQLFCGAVDEYGLPARVRSDCGRENIKVYRILFIALVGH